MKSSWKTRDGKRILIKDMTDEHLLNTIRFLKRKAKKGVMAIYVFPFDAEDACPGDVVFLYGEDVLREVPEYKHLKKEAKLRGIWR